MGWGVGENHGYGETVSIEKSVSSAFVAANRCAESSLEKTDMSSGKRECIATEVPVLVLQGIQGVSNAQARCLTSLSLPSAGQGALFRA